MQKNIWSIAKIITKINTSFSLNSSNIVLTVTDNGSNFLKAFREYGVENYFFEDNIDNESCLPTRHTLNLLASTDFNKILKTEQKLFIQNNRVIKINSEIIAEHLGSMFLLPVVTR